MLQWEESYFVRFIRIDDQQQADGKELQPREIHQYLSRIMYQRRSKVDPLWNQILVAGVGDKDDRIFLGQCDLYGSAFEGDTLATGYGAYIAQPLLRKAFRPDLTEDEARKVLIDCMRVLLYRDARTINKVTKFRGVFVLLTDCCPCVCRF